MTTSSLYFTPSLPRAGRVMRRMVEILPGLALCVALAGASYGLAEWPALNAVVPMSALTIGILVGVLVRLGLPIPAPLEPGIRWTLHYVLRAGIVLLGFKLVLQDMASVGIGGLALVVVLVASTIMLAVMLGRWLKLPDTLSVLVGTGTGICGASAVVAVDGVIKGREQDVACAIAMVTVLGSIAMLSYPLLAPALGLNEAGYAVWAGGSIHEVAQAVAAGFAYREQAGIDASLFKLSRVAMLAPACTILAIWWRRRAGSDASDGGGGAAFPMFVLLFVAVALFNSVVTIPQGLHTKLVSLDSGLLAAAMVAMGLQTRVAAVFRLGWRPMCLGLVVAAWISLLALGGGMLLG